MEECSVLIETTKSAEDKTSRWFDLPIDYELFCDLLGVEADSGDYQIIDMKLPFAGNIVKTTSVRRLNKLYFDYMDLQPEVQQAYKELMKQLTNQMCRERGLTVVEKGKHFDGSQIEKGEVIAWSKDKYNLFRQQVKDSFVADCAMAVLKALENCISKEKFIEKMKQFGWNVNWSEKRKHITFQNQDGKKVRDCNLSKTFHLDISKEDLENEFDRNYERVRAGAERTNGADEELAGYYRQVEAACEGAGGVTGASDGRERRVTGEKSEDERVYPEISGKDTQDETGKTEAILRESRNARRNSEVKRRNLSFDNRNVRNAEAESIASEEQRRFEEQKRFEEQERARAARRRNKRRSGPEL